MLFFEYGFLFVFLPIVLVVYAAVPERWRNAWLLLASLFFYSASSFEFLPILLGTIAFDFLAGNRIAASEQPRTRRLWLIGSLTLNLGLLGYFKYIGFVTSTLQSIVGPSVPLVTAKFPIGISFYVFLSMSYTIDVFRRQVPAARSLVDFATFVSCFPHLIAGPIVRYSYLAPQIEKRTHEASRIASGVTIFVAGLAKKLLIADTLASVADPIFRAGSPGFVDAWLSMFLYAGQIYFDFSGYSDMAIGLGRLFGLEFPKNFDSPYRAVSFSDFWRRWHITLSTWLRDYLYVSLGGNRRGRIRTYLNLMLTMLLGGLWHGASWSFVLWGAGHGALLALERSLRGRTGVAVPEVLRRAFVFLCVTTLWVPFRLENMSLVGRWLSAMFLGAHGLGAVAPSALLAALTFGALVWLPVPSVESPIRRPLLAPAAVALLFVVTLLVGYGRLAASPFLYFRF
jgi:alginate O-acetyltransferase complex protein AlgI